MLQPVSVKTRDPLKRRVQPRRFHKRLCPRCHKPHWTSAKNLSHLCGTCQQLGWNEKKADLYYGILGYDRRVTHGGSLAVRAVPASRAGAGEWAM